jgi:hypothetical protein
MAITDIMNTIAKTVADTTKQAQQTVASTPKTTTATPARSSVGLTGTTPTPISTQAKTTSTPKASAIKNINDLKDRFKEIQIAINTKKDLSSSIINNPITLVGGDPWHRVMVSWEDKSGKTIDVSVKVDRLNDVQSEVISKGGRILSVYEEGKSNSPYFQQPTTAEWQSAYKTELTSSFNKSGYIPPDIKKQIIIPPEISSAGLGSTYQKISYEKFLGIDTTRDEKILNQQFAIANPQQLSPSEQIQKDYSTLSWWDQVIRNLSATYLSGPERMVSGIATDISNIISGIKITRTGSSMIPLLYSYKDQGKPSEILAAIDSGINPLSLNIPSTQVAELEYGTKQESNPYIKWLKVQAPTYEYFILPVVGGAAVKVIGASLEIAGPIASGIIRGTGAATQYGLLPASIGIPLGTIIAKTGLTSPETIKFGLSTAEQFALFGVAYGHTNVAEFNRFSSKVSDNFSNSFNYAKEGLYTNIPSTETLKLSTNAFKTANLEFKNQFYNLNEVFYRNKYGMDSFGNPQTFLEESKQNIGRNINQMKQPFVNLKDTLNVGKSNIKIADAVNYYLGISDSTDFEIKNQYIESGYRITDTIYGEKFVQKINVRPFEYQGKTIQNIEVVPQSKFDTSWIKMQMKPQQFYKGMADLGSPDVAMNTGKPVQVDFFGEAVFENERIKPSEDFLKWQKSTENKILEQKFTEMNGMKIQKGELNWYTYGKDVKILNKPEPFEMSSRQINVNIKRPYYHSNEQLGLPSEAMTSEMGKLRDMTWKNSLRGASKDTLDTLKGISRDTGLNLTYEEALNNMGKLTWTNKEAMKLNRSYDYAKYGLDVEKNLVQTNLNIKDFKPDITITTLTGKPINTPMKFYKANEALGLPPIDLGEMRLIKTSKGDMFALLDKTASDLYWSDKGTKSSMATFDTSYMETKVPAKYLNAINYGIINTSNYWNQWNPPNYNTNIKPSLKTSLKSSNISDIISMQNKNVGNIPIVSVGEININKLGEININKLNQRTNQEQIVWQNFMQTPDLVQIPIQDVGQMQMQIQIPELVQVPMKNIIQINTPDRTPTKIILPPPIGLFGDSQSRKKEEQMQFLLYGGHYSERRKKTGGFIKSMGFDIMKQQMNLFKRFGM